MKCPYCEEALQRVDDLDFIYHCDNVFCEKTEDMGGTKELWQELIRTRKALDVAKDKLDTVRQYHRGTAVIRPDDIAAYCDRAIDKIKEITESPAENVQPDTKSRPVNVQKIEVGELAYLQKENSDLKDEVEYTRKALDVAKEGLKRIDWCATDYGAAQDALDKITALEQKDVK